MQNFIGPLSGEAKEHAETHATNGTDPLTPDAIGAAAASHTHAASAINSGTVAIANGGTGASTATAALTNLGAAAASHTHTASAITNGQLAIANGGTGASTATQARINLGVPEKRAIFSYNFSNTSNTNRLESGLYDINLPIGLPFSTDWVFLIQVTHASPDSWFGLQIVQDFWSTNLWVRRIQNNNGAVWNKIF